GPFSRNFLFEEAKTDKQGKFQIDRLYLKDQSTVMLNAKNERDRANTEIILDPQYLPESDAPVDSINKIIGDVDIPVMFYRHSYLRQMAIKEFVPEEGTIMIGDVEVIGDKPEFEGDLHHRLYSEPDVAVKVSEDDYLSYPNVYEYLIGKVAGVDVTSNDGDDGFTSYSITIRGNSGPPMFLLDGVPDNIGLVSGISMKDIDKIEVLKSGYATSFYGSKGGNGVIAIYTRHGDNKAEIEKYVKGRIELTVNGFQQPNSFYSPKYTLKNLDREEPDNRPTLYWSPEVKIDDEQPEAELYTCDDLSNYLIIAEGVSKNGKIFSAVKKFSVSNTTTIPRNVKKLNSQTDTILYEKVYLHIDRELYSPGDTLWFKSYLVKGLSNKPQRGYKNIYVQLVAPSGEVISNRLLLSENGNAHGDFALNDSLPDGQYTVRAYTKYLQGFGEESYFHKRIWISAPKSSLEIHVPEINDSLVVDAMFFPESGNLIENVNNHVAFKVIGSDGRGVKASGKITDEKGETIVRFKTAFLGMGSFVFKPMAGKKYYATIDNFPEIKYPFEDIVSDGISMHYSEKNKKAEFTLAGNFSIENQKNLFLLATHKGIELFYETITMDKPEKVVSFDKQRFPTGISKITLYDENFNVLSERLVFVDNNIGNSVLVELHKEAFTTRERVNLSIEPLLASKDSVSGLSVSVVSEDYLSSVGNNQNIKSYLLVDSELKGVIESPALYFFDEEGITSSEKLDLLMMVQGWRSYYWDDLIKLAPRNSGLWDDAGLSFTGRVTGLFSDKVVTNGEVRLGPYSPQFLFENTKTDSYGQFLFENLYMPDSAEVMVFATNEKGKNSVDVTLQQPLFFESKAETQEINNSLGKINIPMKYYREIYMQQMAENAFIPDSGSIMIGEVEVVAITNKDVYELTKPFYDFYPTKSFIITEEDYKYESIYDFLLLKVDSRYLEDVDKEGNPAIVVYLDGRLIDSTEILSLENAYMDDVYRIDYRRKELKNAFDRDGVPETFYIYRNKVLKEFRPTVWGKAVIQAKGFQQPHKFYSPKYTFENISNKLPDYRPTLYWSPEVLVKDGKASLEFFTCDNLSDYVVIVEGISKNGKICYGTGRFSVTK
ncbi:MAG: TonB-dependent receptor plug domain-containing protein, partial [Prolixibacteraceae bacterium]|nr:TonB-dependent receptor plug domain-containing protein [Prolixibacteraceae bacterium]